MKISSSIETNPLDANQHVILIYVGIFYDKDKAEAAAIDLKEYALKFQPDALVEVYPEEKKTK